MTKRSGLLVGIGYSVLINLSYSARILGLPLGRYYSFKICCQICRIVSTRKPDYLDRELQFGRLAKLSNAIVRR
jgi:hypothetical protein